MSAGRTARALREHSQRLETELNAATAERDAARARAERAEADLAALEQSFDDNCRGVVRIDAELAKERARLDSGQILLTVAGERVWHSGVDLRAAIDAAMKEDAK
jgi:predicted  nucleic acid-binding Zn-ribbon protein